MSHPINTQWLEAAAEHFEGAIEAGDYSLARDVIADVRDAGFGVEAATLEQTLLNTPMSRFVHRSPIQPI